MTSPMFEPSTATTTRWASVAIAIAVRASASSKVAPTSADISSAPRTAVHHCDDLKGMLRPGASVGCTDVDLQTVGLWWRRRVHGRRGSSASVSLAVRAASCRQRLQSSRFDRLLNVYTHPVQGGSRQIALLTPREIG